MQPLDMLGQPCPIPVIKAKNALAQPGCDGVVVAVDNIVAVQNLEKMANGFGYGFSYTQQGEKHYDVAITTSGVIATVEPAGESAAAPTVTDGAGLTVLITSDAMGSGSEELGKILIKGFLFSLTELPTPPERVIFLNAGALLTAEGANTVPDLLTLEGLGCEILTCGTCSNYYQLQDKLAVGSLTDMFGIAARLASASRLISL